MAVRIVDVARRRPTVWPSARSVVAMPRERERERERERTSAVFFKNGRKISKKKMGKMPPN